MAKKSEIVDDKRIIHTKLYSKIASEILDSVIGQLSDGLWENSPRMESYWHFANVKTLPNGEVVIEVPTCVDKYCFRRYVINGFYGMSDVEVIQWFANKIKQIMQCELKDSDDPKSGWKRNNNEFFSYYLSNKTKITVSDVYFIYEFLLGRADILTSYTDYSLKCANVIGQPKSGKEEKAEIIRRKHIDGLNKKRDVQLAKIDRWKEKEIDRINKEFFAKREVVFEEFNEKKSKYEVED